MFFCQIVALDKSLIYIYTSICQLFQGFPLTYARRSQSTQEMAMSLQQAFSKLQPRDVIICDNLSYVIIREISHEANIIGLKSRYIVGQLSYDRDLSGRTTQQMAHISTILQTAYAWNTTTWNFSDTESKCLPDWNKNATVERGAYKGEDIDAVGSILIAAEVELGVFPESITPKKIAQIVFFSISEDQALASVAKLLGLTLTKFQANLLHKTLASYRQSRLINGDGVIIDFS